MHNKIFGLYAIVDTTFSPQYSHAELAQLILLGGCRLIQLRMKAPRHSRESGNLVNALDPRFRGDDKPGWNRRVFEEAKKIMELKKKFNFTFIINDHVDVAGELKADGVHVGPNDTPVREARRRLGDKFIIGYSSSKGIDLGIAAEQDGADYIAFGAIYPTKAKGPDHPVQGLDRLKDICTRVKKPVVAIGGINRTNIDDVLSCGPASVAIIRGITEAKDVVEETKWYMETTRHGANS